MAKLSEDALQLLKLVNKKDEDCFFVDRKIHQIRANVKGKQKDVVKMLFKVDKTYLDLGEKYKSVLSELRDFEFIKKNKEKINKYDFTDKGFDFLDNL